MVQLRGRLRGRLREDQKADNELPNGRRKGQRAVCNVRSAESKEVRVVMPIADTQIMSTVAHMNTLISYDCECAVTKKEAAGDLGNVSLAPCPNIAKIGDQYEYITGSIRAVLVKVGDQYEYMTGVRSCSTCQNGRSV